MVNTLVILGFVLFATLLLTGVVWRRRSAIVFCPVREQPVHVEAGRCLAADENGFVIARSIWGCQRPCLEPGRRNSE
jgi:hypothetical protein